MKKFETMTGKDINVKDGLKIKNENNSKFIEHDVINLLCDEHYLMHLQFLYF